MIEKTVLVVFPSIYSLNKINKLATNISKALKIKNYGFNKIRKEESLIIVDAIDPVLASSAISMLFGIDKVAIVKEVENNFDTALSTMTSTFMNLLLRGEKFLVKVDGKTDTYLGKDLEVAATTSLIDNAINIEAKAGTELDHQKILYTILTRSHAYVCIFVDKGLGGLPFNSQEEKILCCIHDELSAISCLQAIKMGFDVQLVVCYHNESVLLKLVKIINKILPRMIQEKIKIRFCRIPTTSLTNTLIIVTHVLIYIAEKEKIRRIGLAISPMIFPSKFSEYNANLISQKKLIPWFPLSGIDSTIIENAKEIGLEKYIIDLKNICKVRYNTKAADDFKALKYAKESIKSLKSLSITVGSKNIHDMIDSLKSNH